jgi:ribosomal protein L27
MTDNAYHYLNSEAPYDHFYRGNGDSVNGITDNYIISGDLSGYVTIDDSAGSNVISIDSSVTITEISFNAVSTSDGAYIFLSSGVFFLIEHTSDYTFIYDGRTFDTFWDLYLTAYYRIFDHPYLNSYDTELRIDEIAEGSDPVTNLHVGQFSATDPNGDPLTYSIVVYDFNYDEIPGFNIDSDGNITYTGDSLDADQFRYKYLSILITISDGVNEITLGDTYVEFPHTNYPLHFTLNDITDEAPVFTSPLKATPRPENTEIQGRAMNSEVIYAATVTPDVDGEYILWTLSGEDAELFDIYTDGRVRFKEDHTPDHESKSVYNFTVVARTGALYAEQGVVLEIIDLLDAPPEIISALRAEARPENVEITGGANGTVVYTAQARPDVAGDTIVWTLRGADAGLFDIYTDGKVRFKTDHTPDYDTKSEYNITLVATTGAFERSENLTIHVIESNPPVLTIGGTTADKTVLEGEVLTLTEQMLSVSDPDYYDNNENGLPTGSKMVFTLVSAARGTVTVDGSEIAANGTFTLEQLREGLVTFRHDGEDPDTTPASITVNVRDGYNATSENGTLILTTIDVVLPQFNLTGFSDTGISFAGSVQENEEALFSMGIKGHNPSQISDTRIVDSTGSEILQIFGPDAQHFKFMLVGNNVWLVREGGFDYENPVDSTADGSSNTYNFTVGDPNPNSGSFNETYVLTITNDPNEGQQLTQVPSIPTDPIEPSESETIIPNDFA